MGQQQELIAQGLADLFILHASKSHGAGDAAAARLEALQRTPCPPSSLETAGGGGRHRVTAWSPPKLEDVASMLLSLNQSLRHLLLGPEYLGTPTQPGLLPNSSQYHSWERQGLG